MAVNIGKKVAYSFEPGFYGVVEAMYGWAKHMV